MALKNVDRLRALIGKGYFPKELPPVFTTTDFGMHVGAVLSEWEDAKVFQHQPAEKVPGRPSRYKKSGSYGYVVPAPDPEVISCPKRGYERRNIHITHPVPQGILAREIADNWRSIAKWLCRGRYSLDVAQISGVYPRAIKPLNFEAHRAKKAYIEASADWIVKTDISRFYPSIYTHSIAWAAYEKEKIKKAPNFFKGSLADRLDLLVRSCNRNQTVGIPIGPETSRIIADIISVRIESDIETKCRISFQNVDRLQDDWFIGAPTLEVAEKELSWLTHCYRSYGLDINGSKTAVERTVSPMSETWVGEMGAFLAHNNSAFTRARLREFLNLTLRLQLELPKEPVVRYALSVLESRRSSIKDVEALESFLLRAAAGAPLSMDRICSMLLNLQSDTQRVSIDRVRNRFVQLAERSIVNGNTYEALWLLFTLRGLKASFKSEIISRSAENCASSALILILLDMKSKNLIMNKLPLGEWEDMINAERVLKDWTWLYAYEGIRHGWLQDKTNVMGSPFFSSLISRDIQFYDPRRNVSRTIRTVSQRRAQRRNNANETMRLIAGLRGFDVDVADY